MKILLPPVTNPRVLSSNKRSIIHASLAGLVLSSACLVAQAVDPSSVPNQPSYTIKIINTAPPVVVAKPVLRASTPAATKTTTKATTYVSKRVATQATKITGKLIEQTQRQLRLSNGGVIWVSNDPVALTPRLSVDTRQQVLMKGDQFARPISFKLSTNYAAFIKRWDIQVFEASDDDQRRPLVSLSGTDIINGQTVQWDGKTSNGHQFKAGDELTYLLTVRDARGHVDKTFIKSIALQAPRTKILTKKAVSKTILANSIETQTIPLQGARVRLFGNDIVRHQNVTIDGEKVTLNNSKFVVERILPAGQHHFDISIKDGQKAFSKRLHTQVDGRYMFMVGLADVTAGKGKVTGNLESLGDGDKRLNGDVFVDGRLAFYLKGKIRGRYLVTAQMDTGTAEIDELFDDIHKKDPKSLFRRLDPDKYYPVYGDDSTLIDDTNSQGKMYVRVDWDKSQAIWGNFNTDMTGTEFSAFNRSLYGAKLNYKSTRTTRDGKHKTDVTVFAAEAQSAFRHNQFLGTGGSLYYLKDKDIVDGSEKVWIEVRERNGDRVVQQVVMEAGRDYQIDDFQGRLILNRPLLQIAEQAGPSLVKDSPLDGNQVYLMVDYEYVPDDFDADKASYGARGKAWLGNHIAVGGTYVHEDRNDNDYELKGVDITLQKAKGTYLVAEYAETEALQSKGNFFSEDGGLKFGVLDDALTASNIAGTAYSVEARANLKGVINRAASLGAWYKHRDAGFSTARLAQGEETVDAGVEAILELSKILNISAKATVHDKKASRKLTTASIQGDLKLRRATLSAELRHVEEVNQGAATVANPADGEGTLAAFKVGFDVNDDTNLYLVAQSTLNKTGNYESNDLVTLGAKAKLTYRVGLVAEVSKGDRGEAATVGIDYKHSTDHKFYTNYTLSKESKDTQRNLFTVGHRKSVTDRLSVFSEHQFTRETLQYGLGHNVGLDYDLTKHLVFNASLQSANLEQTGGGITDRNAVSVGLSYNKHKTKASSRLEYRLDKGDANDTEQWVTTNRIDYRVNPSLRVQGKLNASETRDPMDNTKDAKFIESGVGFALRPTHNDRLNILGRLTHLYDLPPSSQSNSVDEQSLIGSLETTYQVNQRWQVGGKLAHKEGQIRSDRDAGTWEKNDATLAAARVRYHFLHNWDAMGQYHWLNSDASQDLQHGAVVSVDRHLGKNLKLGIGYNFTQFDDDLSNTDGTEEGVFVNLVGKF